MPTPALILETKLRPPRIRDGLVSRARLLDRLRQGRGRRLTLVCAPAGYGKTTLLAQWADADSDRTPFAWLSLDEGDADPVRLWHQMLSALGQVHPPAGAESADVVSAGLQAIESVVIPLLVNELVDAPDLVLVLEDWHVLKNPLCDETMRLFVEHVPEPVQVVISSRSDPGLPLPRLRAHDDLAEVREEHLRLSPHETEELFGNAAIRLDCDDVERLTSRTEGWAAGLHLAAIALMEQEDPRAFVDAFSGDDRHILDFLARDVLDAVPGDMRDFLVRSSVLERLSAQLCDWTLETSNSAAMLADIERANLFLVSLDDSGEVYRYHQLFASMLRRELAARESEVMPRLHARASAWFEQHGDVESAVGHAIAAHDVRRASDLVTLHSYDYWSTGRVATLGRWLDALSWPDAVADPQLAIVRAIVLGLQGGTARALERWIEVAVAGSYDGPLANGMHSIESGVALLRSLFMTKGLEGASADARRAIELEPPDSMWRPPALAAYGQALYLLGRRDEARAPLEEARRLQGAPGRAGAAQVLSCLAFVELELGRVSSAERLAREALALLETQHLSGTIAAANPHLALGGALALGTDLHGAVEHFERAIALTSPLIPSYWHVHALLRLAHARDRLGDVGSARAALEAARHELNALPDAGILVSLLAETEERLSGRHRREAFLGETLSESELRVLRLLANGRSLREVAGELYLSPNTVKTHRRTIYRKLGANSRKEALERAAELGLVEP